MAESADTLKERERCAKVAEDHECGEVYPDNCHCWARIASNIRQPPANDNPNSPASSPEATQQAPAYPRKLIGPVLNATQSWIDCDEACYCQPTLECPKSQQAPAGQTAPSESEK